MNIMEPILVIFVIVIFAVVLWNVFSCSKSEPDDLDSTKEGFYNVSYPVWNYDYYPWRMYPRWYEYYNTPKWWRFNKWYYNRPSWWLPKY